MKTQKILFVASALVAAATLAAQAQVTGSVNSDGFIVVTGNGEQAAGIDIMSAGGHLVPVPDPPGASPFTFLLSNSASQITWGNLGTRVTLDGDWVTAAGYTGAGGDDLSASWGDGATPVAFPISVGAPLPTPHMPVPSTCDEASGVQAFPPFRKALCVTSSSGRDVPVDEVPAVGSDVFINVSSTVAVPAGETVVDIFQMYNGEFTAPPALEYTATFAWTDENGQPVQADPNTTVLREWVGNFNYSPPKALPITFVNAPDPDQENKPAEFSWILDPATGMATGAKIESRVFDALPTDVLPQIERYHWQIGGLPEGTNVAFTKYVTGGKHVPAVPEPGAMPLLGIGALGLMALRRRGR